MTDLSRLRSLEQITAERERLEQQAQVQARMLEKDVEGIRRIWESKFSRVRRLANVFSFLNSGVCRTNLLTTLVMRLLRPLIRRMRR